MLELMCFISPFGMTFILKLAVSCMITDGDHKFLGCEIQQEICDLL